MLRSLRIKDFALVDNLEIEFESGMNTLTGETGAGKSIIVGAIARLLGEKASKEDIRSGAGSAVIEGEFDICHMPKLMTKLNELGIRPEEDVITLRAEIPAGRASRILVNGKSLARRQLHEISGYLGELLGQHSHQQLLDEKYHQEFLDRFAGISDDVRALGEIHDRWTLAERELNYLESRRNIERSERELLLFQKDEIDKTRIRLGEEEELLAERKILDAAHVLGEKSSAVLSILDSEGHSALSMLKACRKELGDMADIDKATEKYTELIEESIINLEEIRTDVESYASSIPDNPERLEQINSRLDQIYRLKKKYGGSEEAILATLEKITQQLARKIDVNERIEILRREIEGTRREYIDNARQISERRKTAASRLADVIEKELAELGFESAHFTYDFIYEPDPDGGVNLQGQSVKPGPYGLETGRFLISANPGEPLKPLARTASGGEISRIMLALKASDKKIAGRQRPLLVFDEVDAGIGGAVANTVAERLSKLSADFQLLVVTHLHQIAAVSDQHYGVEKVTSKSDSRRKTIVVRKLSAQDRKREIKRMLSLPSEGNKRGHPNVK
jgi:DNA repair protein RecN (Recombination protein N)